MIIPIFHDKILICVPYKSTIFPASSPRRTPRTSNQQSEAPAEASQDTVQQPRSGIAQEQQSGTAREEVDEKKIFAVRLHIAWSCSSMM